MSEDAAPRRPDGIAFAGRRFRVRLETMPHPLGGERQFEIVEAPPAAAIVPVLMASPTGDPMVLLVEQERPVIGGPTLEIPAGLVHLSSDEADNPEQTAARELREETGYAAGKLHHLTSIYSSPGITDEVIHIYLATNLTSDSQAPSPEDPTEIMGVRRLPLREAVSMAARGEFRDAKTTIGLLLAGAMLLGTVPRPSQIPDAGGGTAMPVDPISMPFIPTEGRGTAAEAGGDPGALSLEAILAQEFGYANVTAYQAMEDRARIFNLYLLLVGVLASALTAIFQLGAIKDYILPLTFVLLFLAGLLGVVFFLHIIRLRQAHRDSVIAMNRIKEYYIRRLIPLVPDAGKAFHWRLRTIPRGERLGSVTYLVSFTIAFLGSLCFAGAFIVGVHYADSQGWGSARAAISSGTIYLLALVVLLISLLLHTLYYRVRLSKKADAKILKVEEDIIGPSAEH